MSDGGVFERDFSLHDLLAGPELPRLRKALAQLLGDDGALLAPDGEALWGSAPAKAAGSVPIALEIEPIAWLVSGAADTETLRGAAAMIQLVLLSRARYLMASDLHLEAIKADFEALRVERDALAASEARYRKLSTELEQRVAEQVEIIDERQRQLYQAEKLASVGQLAAGVAHEINNPIGFVRSNLSSAQGYLAKLQQYRDTIAGNDAAIAAWQHLDLDFAVEDFTDILGESIGGIDRVARIVRDLKGFSSIEQPEEAVVDLNDNLREVCTVINGQRRENVALQLQLAELPKVMCLPGHLNQVFLNVLQNALQAVNDAGKAGDIVVASRPAQGGTQVEISIRDNGPGIPPEALPKVFNPFFTTRPVGQGTGLGLTVARDIVRAHSGEIAIASPPPDGGRGTVVTILLPAT